ncbi:MAG: preprotein translocase subunit SecG [Bacillota bacterium]|nr:preprotein translocase subunit SecG [Bacillota bacterium]
MGTVLTVLFVLASVVLGVVVLLQPGKSAGLSGAIGGGAEQIFGKRSGLDRFLSRVTVGAAVVLAAVAMALAFVER